MGISSFFFIHSLKFITFCPVKLFRLLADIPDEDWLIYLFTIVNTFQGSAVAAALTYQYRKKILKLIKSIPVCRTRVTPEVVNVNVPTDGTLPRSSLTVTTIDPSTV